MASLQHQLDHNPYSPAESFNIEGIPSTSRLPMIPYQKWPLSAPIGAEVSSFEDRDLSRLQ